MNREALAARLLTEAARWQVMDALVRAYDGDMAGVAFAPDTVTDAVLALSGELAEHLRDPEEVARWTGRFIAEVTERPVSPKDVLQTMYHLLGVAPETLVHDRLNRPYPLVSEGELLRELV